MSISFICGIGGGGEERPKIHFGENKPTDDSTVWIKSDPCTSTIISSQKGEQGVALNNSVASMIGLEYASSCYCNGYIYIFGGKDTQGDVDTIYKFSIQDNSVTELSTTLPRRMHSLSTVSVDKNVYIFGGEYQGEFLERQLIGSAYVFNSETDSIMELSIQLPQEYQSGLSGMSSTAIDKNIYLYGGYELIGGSSQSVNYLFMFNTETNSFDRVQVNGDTPPNTAYCGIVSYRSPNEYIYSDGSVSENDYIDLFVIGGSEYIAGSTNIVHSTIHKIQIEEGTICTCYSVSNMGSPMFSPYAFRVNSHFYIIGDKYDGNSSDDSFEFDPINYNVARTDWEWALYNRQIYGLHRCCTFYENRLYIFGGEKYTTSELYQNIRSIDFTENIVNDSIYIESYPKFGSYSETAATVYSSQGLSMDITPKFIIKRTAGGDVTLLDSYILFEYGVHRIWVKSTMKQ